MCCMHLWRRVSQEDLGEMKQYRFSSAQWLQGCIVGEGQFAAHGA